MPVLYEIFQTVPSSMDHARAMAMHDCKQCQLPIEFSALGQLGYLRKSESMSGHVPVFMCCEYHFLDGTMNFLFLINSYSKNPTTLITIVTMMIIMMPLSLMVS